MLFLASEGRFWPPTASMASEVKNNYAYVLCGMYALMAKSSISTLNILRLLIRFKRKSKAP